ncbi:MAG TPA: hypothetical protein VFH56_15005 [Acidimicrobiales bacterium]|nr:hypothetical protein [Acidimicrobiales bacterium]
MTAHNADTQHGADYHVAYCGTCDFRARYASASDARDARDAHILFTHVTGGRECGEPLCRADRTVRRLRRRAEAAGGA